MAVHQFKTQKEEISQSQTVPRNARLDMKVDGNCQDSQKDQTGERQLTKETHTTC